MPVFQPNMAARLIGQSWVMVTPGGGLNYLLVKAHGLGMGECMVSRDN